MGDAYPGRFDEFEDMRRREVDPITHRAFATAALARKNRTNLQTFNADPLKVCGDLFINELIRFDDFLLLIHRVRDGLAADAANNSLPKIDYFLVAFVNRAHHDAVSSAAVSLLIHYILRSVHQFACQIAGVRSL